MEKKGLSGLGKLSRDDMVEFRKQMSWEPGGIQEKIFMDRYDVASLKYNKEKFLWVLKEGGVPEKYKNKAMRFVDFQERVNTDFSKNSIGNGLTRAMSWEEWTTAVESGYFSSTGDMNVLAAKNVTFFGWIQETLYYAINRQVASRTKPNVIIEFSAARTNDLINSGLLSKNKEYKNFYQASEPVPAKGLKHLLYVFPDKSFSNITQSYGDFPEYYYVDVSDEIPAHMR